MNRVSLAAQGLTYPGERRNQHFLAALDVLDVPWGAEAKADAVGAWASLVDEVRSSGLDAIVSHELLGRATAEQVETVVSPFRDAKVEVVITARDLGRLIPAEYQEHLKHRSVMTYRTFLDQLREPKVDDEAGDHARHTWAVQDVPAIADRWAEVVGRDNVTIVTVPPSDAPRQLLPQRFGEAVGFDATLLRDAPDLGENRSLGVVEAELIRRLNENHNAELDDAAYAIYVRDRLVSRQASREVEAAQLRLPAEEYGWIRQVSADWVDALRSAGYRVIGDLDELLPEEPGAAPETVDEARLLETALRELAHSAADYADLFRSLPEPPEQPLRARFVQRSKEAVLRQASKRPLGQRFLRAWESRH